LTSFPKGYVNCPRWSPDGDTVVFTALQNSNQDIYAVSADGGSPRRLTFAAREGRATRIRSDDDREFPVISDRLMPTLFLLGPQGRSMAEIKLAL
jgi:Tol biopolymer transport system component